MEPLIRLLEKNEFPKLQEAALEAISSLCYGNYKIAASLNQMKSNLVWMIQGNTLGDPIITIVNMIRNGSHSLKLFASAW